MDHEKYRDNLKKMKQNLDFISDMSKDILKMIENPEDRKQYAEITADTERAIELMKKGDSTELIKLQEKYADKNS